MYSSKVCFKCGAEKPLTEFYAHPAMKDGTVNKCKSCNKADVKQNRSDKKEYYQRYEKSRASKDERVAARKQYAKTPAGIENGNRSKIRYIGNNPVKRVAHIAVGNAVRDGVLHKQPCEVCGDENNIHAHHDDYAKLLDVRWLCSYHHSEWHKHFGEGRNG